MSTSISIEQFQKHVDECAKIVNSWPKWKRELMDEIMKPYDIDWDEISNGRKRYSWWPNSND